MITRLRIATLSALLALAAGCGGDSAPDDKAMDPADKPMNKEQSQSAAMNETADDGAAPGLGRSDAPTGATVYFENLADGDEVSSPVEVSFGLDMMDVVPAGTDEPESGHHHVIIDSDLPPFDAPIPADARHVHFGDGSSSTELELAPGEHTLQLLLGDHLHIPHQPPVYSEKITITVK